VKRRQWLFAIFKGIVSGIFAGQSASADDDLDPVKMMPDTHKLLFENAFVRVIEGRVPAGGFEPKHRHPHCVLVNLVDFDSEVRTLPDGEWKHMHRAFGTATWSDATVHEVRIVENVPSHTVRVELKC
jgi:hypothetical protein